MINRKVKVGEVLLNKKPNSYSKDELLVKVRSVDNSHAILELLKPFDNLQTGYTYIVHNNGKWSSNWEIIGSKKRNIISWL